jgi:hypothetical protein
LLDQIAGCVESGKLNVEIDLQAGRAQAAPRWTVEVIGAPKATLVAEAVDGRVRRLDLAITEGKLLVDGKGLRPDVFVESIHFDTDVTLFQMPENLPFTIESVDSGADWLAIAGKIAWA